MNINRNNYEEFFLLYADGELTPAEMQAVDSFTHQHPDLAEELQMLMEVVLPHEMATMPGKNRLLKLAEWNENTPTPQQTALLMHLDGELPTTQAMALENNLAQSENLQKDWDFLQHTKLLAPAATMANKSSLYRQTVVRRPISPLWSRLAAAAIIAGVGWFLISDNNEPTSILPERTNIEKTTTSPTPQNKNTPNVTVDEKSTASITNATEQTQPVTKSAIEEKAVTATVKGLTTTPENDQQGVVANNQTVVSTQEESTPSALIRTTTHPNIENTEPTLHTQYMVASNAVHTTNPIAQPVADAYEFAREDEPEYLYIAGTKIKKQKVRGFIRTVGRTVTRGFTNGNIAQVDSD